MHPDCSINHSATFMMRVSYLPPTASHFDVVFTPYQNAGRGGSLRDIKVLKPYYYQRGGSLFGILGSIIKRSIPFLKNFILPEAGNFAMNLAKDINENVPVKTSIKQNLVDSVKNIGKKVMRGGKKQKKGRKTKSSKKRARKKKKDFRKGKCHAKNKKDVFTGNMLEF